MFIRLATGGWALKQSQMPRQDAYINLNETATVHFMIFCNLLDLNEPFWPRRIANGRPLQRNRLLHERPLHKRLFRLHPLHVVLQLRRDRWHLAGGGRRRREVRFGKMDQSRPLFRLFSSFQTNISIFTTKICENIPSSSCCWDSNTRPSWHESPTITIDQCVPYHRFYILSVTRCW